LDRARSTDKEVTDLEQQQAAKRKRYRRAHQPQPRNRKMEMRLSEQEYTTIEAAAKRARMANGAYAARMTLAAAHDFYRPELAVLREHLLALTELIGQVRRIGINLNQAVTALNTTGQAPPALLTCTASTTDAMTRLRELTTAINQSLP
jgi:hypothetical protein